MSDTCVCGGSIERPNVDCERCQLIAQITRLTAELAEANQRIAELEKQLPLTHSTARRTTMAKCTEAAKLHELLAGETCHMNVYSRATACAGIDVYLCWKGDPISLRGVANELAAANREIERMRKLESAVSRYRMVRAAGFEPFNPNHEHKLRECDSWADVVSLLSPEVRNAQ